jgi:hypothetical protein
MIEKTIFDFLNNNLSVPAFMEEQKVKVDKFVLIEKIGGSEENFIKRANVTIQSIAPTLYEAASLNEEVKEVINNIVLLDEISKVSLNSDYNYTDTSQKRYRYQAVFDLFYY